MTVNTLIDEKAIQKRIKELALKIEQDYSNEEIVLIITLKGAVFFATELAKSLSLPTIIDFIKVSSYSGTQSTREISFNLDSIEDIKN